jgi:glycosyltransferase involved in cell wall biosynthesis
MKLSVIVPVYNEINTIARVIDDLLAVELNCDREIVVVDDGSCDGTREYLSSLNNPLVEVFFHEKNMGKTAGINTGLKKFTGDIVVIQDADLEYPPRKNYNILLEPILEGHADVVYGSRFLGVHRVFFGWHYFANRFLTVLTNILFDTMLTDMETGAKAFTREALQGITLTSRGFCFEPEITAKVFKKRLRVYEVPITYYGRSYNEGKKIKPIDGFMAVIALFKYRFGD